MNVTTPLQAHPRKRFTVYEVPSDYMSPTMQPGDLVEIDSTVTRAHADGVYLVAFPAGMPALRRIQALLGNNRVRVVCDQDPAAADECDSKDLRILGRATRAMNVRQL
jgi:phage repressor protein C with HTH and peptisase S24 domain